MSQRSEVRGQEGEEKERERGAARGGNRTHLTGYYKGTRTLSTNKLKLIPVSVVTVATVATVIP